MSTLIRVQRNGGWKEYAEPDFPLPLGLSPEGSIVVGPDAVANPQAWLGVKNRQIFIQSVDSEENVLHNGKRLSASVWMAAGDLIEMGGRKLEVSFESGKYGLSGRDGIAAPLLTPPDELELAKKHENEVEEGEGELPKNLDTKAPGESRVSKEAPPQKPVAGFSPLPKRRSHGGLIKTLYVALAVLLLGAVFVLFSKPVRIEISPTPDEMELSRFPLSIKIGERYLALAGEYRVSASKEGYYDLDEPLVVESGEKEIRRYEMRKLPGFLTIATQPEQGVAIRVGGEAVGETPLARIELTAGSHQLEASAPRYLNSIQEVEMQGMGVEQAIFVQLDPGWGTVLVESDPQGAEVVLDGKAQGVAPVALEPMAGDYELRLTKKGWKPRAQRISVVAGEELSPPVFRLEKSEGYVDIVSKPSQAVVLLNGEFKGNTPVSLTLTRDEDYELGLSKSGYNNLTRRLNVGDGETLRLNLELMPEEGIVFITSQPADAQLKVDGVPMGMASRRLKLSAQPHELEISREGYQSIFSMITPEPGVSKKLEFKLLSHVEARIAAMPPQRVTAEGQTLQRVLVVDPIRFEMGASRREPGRRSNEAQREVVVTRSFYFSEMEVTNAAFRKFRPDHSSGSEAGYDLDEDDQPVAMVSWNDAAAYLNWLSEKDGLPPAYQEVDEEMTPVVPITMGYRLPTEAEWALVSRYEGGATEEPLKYPWGDERFPDEKTGNYADAGSSNILPLVIPNYTDGFQVASPVGSFQANGLGIFDLGGNVSEWCHDYYGFYVPGDTSVETDPFGPETGEYHVIRGASWRHGGITELRLSYRDYGVRARNDVGFRIVRYAEDIQDEN